MPSPENPEDLRAVLLHMAATAGAAPDRQRFTRWLRAALELMDDGPSEPPPAISPAMRRALGEIAEALNRAAEQANSLRDAAGGVTEEIERAEAVTERAQG